MKNYKVILEFSPEHVKRYPLCITITLPEVYKEKDFESLKRHFYELRVELYLEQTGGILLVGDQTYPLTDEKLVLFFGINGQSENITIKEAYQTCMKKGMPAYGRGAKQYFLFIQRSMFCKEIGVKV